MLSIYINMNNVFIKCNDKSDSRNNLNDVIHFTENLKQSEILKELNYSDKEELRMMLESVILRAKKAENTENELKAKLIACTKALNHYKQENELLKRQLHEMIKKNEESSTESSSESDTSSD